MLDLLELTGCATPVRSAGFRPVATMDVAWDRASAPHALPACSLLVDRLRFDAVLRDRAAEVGVDVIRPATVESTTPTDDGWLLSVSSDRPRIRARFLVDATGRPAGRRGSITSGPALLGVTGVWSGDVPHDPAVVAADDGWVWCAPVADVQQAPRCEITAFVDAHEFRSLEGQTSADRYRAIVYASGVVGRSARPPTRIRAGNASAQRAAAVAEERWLRVGDAALALDPLSASGVMRATQSALSAAIVAHTVLTSPGDATVALDHHRRTLTHSSAHHAAWTAESYAAVAAVRRTPYWLARSHLRVGGGDASFGATQLAPMLTPSQVVRRSPSVRFVEVSQVRADRVELGMAIEHPGLDGAVAFLDGIAVVPLLRQLEVNASLGDVVAQWSRTVPLTTAVHLAGWLVRRGVIEQADVA